MSGMMCVLQVGAVGARLLCRLRAYEQAATFQVCPSLEMSEAVSA